MRVRIADRCSSSVMMEFDKVTPLNLTYHYARNYRAKRESTPVELLCPTPSANHVLQTQTVLGYTLS